MGVRVYSIGVALVALTATEAAAQSMPNGAATPTARIAAAERALVDVRVDGRDDDDVWQTAPVIDAFRQFDPEPDAPPSQRTEFMVAYDDDDLFVFVRALDTDPDQIMRSLSRRDVRGPADEIGIYVDAYHDRRSGFSFIVNPDGVRRDFAIFDDVSEDGSWDGVWDVATRVHDQGWDAEFRIPLSQLRFTPDDENVFGFGVRRTIERHPERIAWPAYSRTTVGLMSQLGTLEGLVGLGSAERVEMTPYVLTKNITRPASGGGFDHPQELDGGLDLKVGITPNITLNATVNPDFGQVEADPAVLNLSAFETFFAERRPFFVEGAGHYAFALNCYIVVDCQTNEGLFYSRRIGRSPSLSGLYGDATTATATPIRAATKVTGRTAGGFSFGVLDAVTGGVAGTSSRTVEPRTNYAVARAQQDFADGDAEVDVIFTAVNRAEDQWTAPYLHRSAYVGGGSFRKRFGSRDYEVAGFFAASRVAGSPEVITRTQRNSVHYYQQPNAGLTVDSAATQLSGYSSQLKVGKYGGGITRFESSFVRTSAGFDANDLGFQRRADVTDWSTWAALSFQSPTRAYRWAQVNGNTWHHWNSNGDRIESAMNFNGHMGLHNNWDVHLGGTIGRLGGAVCDRCTRGGPLLRRDISFFPWGGINLDRRRAVAPGIWVNAGRWDAGRSSSLSLSPYVNFRFSTRFTASVSANVYTADDNTQWIGNFQGGTGTHHAFAHLDQRTVSMQLRVNYTMTPDLTFEFYGEPFTSSGSYSDVREVGPDPLAPDYDDRFVAYVPPAGTSMDFTFSQLRTNAVVRWEYLPGSTLFVVWAHGREDFTAQGPREPWQTDFRQLLDLPADHTFLIKVAYWFNR